MRWRSTIAAGAWSLPVGASTGAAEEKPSKDEFSSTVVPSPTVVALVGPSVAGIEGIRL
jgi:hypothetical protein